MKTIRLLDLGHVSALRSQTVYHAVAKAMGPASPDTIILVSSAEPYVCIGFHQDLDQEVDLEFCGAEGLPVVRREVGGGAVYLDRDQLFSQWVFQESSLPGDLNAQFELYVRPLVETYQSLGIDAYLRPVNDIHVEGKKIGGTGAAQIGDARVLVGSLMFDFNKRAMSRVLRVPSEKMRDKVFESLEEYMTTMAELLQEPPNRAEVRDRYLERCAAVLNAQIVPGELTSEELETAAALDVEFSSDAWLMLKSPLRSAGVKIHADVRVVAGALKAPGGLIRAAARLRNGHVDDVTFSGDFTVLPASGLDAIEAAMRGAPADAEALQARVADVYRSRQIEAPGVEPAHFAEVVFQAAAAG